jgi:hypothetical protein
MKTLIRLIPSAIVGLVVGLFVARFVITHPKPSRLQVEAVINESVASLKTNIPSAPPVRAATDTQAWKEFLASVIPPELPPTPSEIGRRLESLAFQARVGNPVRAELDRERLLTTAPIEGIPSLLQKGTNWPNLDTAFSASASLLSRWATRDPQGALAMAKRLPPELAHQGVEAVFNSWIANDLNGALTWLDNCKDSLLKSQGNRVTVTALAKVDPETAIERADSLDTEARIKLFRDAIGAWVEKDRGAALFWLENSAPAELRPDLLRAAVNVWGAREPSEAIDYLLQLPPDSNSRSSLAGPFQHLALGEPDAAVKKLAALPAERVSEDLAESTGLNVAMGFNLSGGKDLSRALALAELVPAGEQRNAFLAGLVKFGAANNVEFALNALPQLPDGRTRENAVSFLIGVWAKQDSVRAGEWINTLPAGRSRDEAAAHYADTVLALDPRAASLWIESVADSQVRSRWVELFYSRWREKDAAVAGSWLRDTPALDERQKARLMERRAP